ncbi:MAG: phosphoglycerate kinase [Clostridia bacterium]|nr:phosphoglycerate kinase [Clostridia bacterium]MBR5265279.1 phosphoglycerate kinase [Clostridia bacterium]
MNYNKKSVTDVDVNGKRVLIRCELNAPQDEHGNVTDATRIVTAVPTVKYLAENGAKVIIITHLGRPKGKVVPSLTVAPIAKEMEKYLGRPIKFVPDIVGEQAKKAVSELKEGEVMMLENIRFDPREEKCEPELSEALAAFGDIFVNEAFGTAHRAHCSTAGVANYLPGYAGFLMEAELDAFGKALTDPKRPFVGILGGSKVSDKIMAIENLLTVCDSIIIGGAMAYTFAKAKWGDIGDSRYEEDKIEYAREVLERAQKLHVPFYLPIDHVCADKFAADADYIFVDGDHIPEGRMALDIGPKTVGLYTDVIKNAKTIVWNGPMGVFEFDAFSKGTTAVAQALAENEGLTIVGGGDSTAAIKKAGVEEHITHISTGGGASLKLLEGAKLPGMSCLLDK